MADINFTPEDMVGAVHRQSVQLAHYLNQPLSEINPAVALDHLIRMHAWLSRLNDLYMQQAASHRSRDGDEHAGATKN